MVSLNHRAEESRIIHGLEERPPGGGSSSSVDPAGARLVAERRREPVRNSKQERLAYRDGDEGVQALGPFSDRQAGGAPRAPIQRERGLLPSDGASW